MSLMASSGTCTVTPGRAISSPSAFAPCSGPAFVSQEDTSLTSELSIPNVVLAAADPSGARAASAEPTEGGTGVLVAAGADASRAHRQEVSTRKPTATTTVPRVLRAYGRTAQRPPSLPARAFLRTCEASSRVVASRLALVAFAHVIHARSLLKGGPSLFGAVHEHGTASCLRNLGSECAQALGCGKDGDVQ